MTGAHAASPGLPGEMSRGKVPLTTSESPPPQTYTLYSSATQVHTQHCDNDRHWETECHVGLRAIWSKINVKNNSRFPQAEVLCNLFNLFLD